MKDRIADAVHKAVCDVTGGSGIGHCDLYALTGTVLLTRVTRKPYQIQVGYFAYLIDPSDNGWFAIDSRDGGLDRMEYHAWIGLAGKPVPDISGGYEVGELIDFSTRHIFEMATTYQGRISAVLNGDHLLYTIDPDAEIIPWTRLDLPPDYLWVDGKMPDEFRYNPDAESIETFYERFLPDKQILRELVRLASDYYRKELS